ncbi:G-type lectin S-receptor-like serine/threonine-protein kinase RKS1 [Eucalyptus grandis]|uniref:G-type lectin S-receptor-like serine/threonine-protein kinase RKS1 n=1 Tax=Eucalyptus grandis TaxID=71139 RepID=UPI00192E8C6D|nr:G-type lectin S-receptor-like serine/threonine-protein kinase RKS1 [Eucalyptus grandis]
MPGREGRCAVVADGDSAACGNMASCSFCSGVLPDLLGRRAEGRGEERRRATTAEEGEGEAKAGGERWSVSGGGTAASGKVLAFSRQSHSEDLELPLFDLTTIVNATNNFSDDNKPREGGFGAVYKGVLKNGQEIAVKRLSESSRQGQVEFKNEVVYITKLQHRNLVKILGCCIEQDEMMLIYEFLPNRSLDCFIFDQEKGVSLDWPMRSLSSTA